MTDMEQRTEPVILLPFGKTAATKSRKPKPSG